MPEIRIVETRPGESITALHRRAEIANQNKGDLFISIHCNAVPPIKHSERIGTKTVTSYVGKGKKRRKITRKVPQYRYWTTPNPRKAPRPISGVPIRMRIRRLLFVRMLKCWKRKNYKEIYGDVDPNTRSLLLYLF
jgi:N-acetylmuramoyl-L-alanine amidase